MKNLIVEIIETASQKAGSQRKLEKELGLGRGFLTLVKTGERGLPEIAQMKLEDYLNLKRGAFRATSLIITEKDPKKISFLAKIAKAEEKAWKFMGDQKAEESVKQILETSKKIVKRITNK
jgi:hypothetical protein